MLPAIIAGLVKDQSPDHAPHSQEFVEFDAMEPRTMRVMCSCSVGLTLHLPTTGIVSPVVVTDRANSADEIAADAAEAMPKKGGRDGA